MEKRHFARFTFREPVGYQIHEDTPDTGSLSKDLSLGGVRIRVQEFIPLRTVLNLKIHLKHPERQVPVKGEVVWVREVPHSEVFDIGIRFIEVHPTGDLREFIRNKKNEEQS